MNYSTELALIDEELELSHLLEFHALTDPCVPKHNGGFDNINYDLIVYINQTIGSYMMKQFVCYY